MPSASLSPHPPSAMPPSPRNASVSGNGSGGGGTSQSMRPPLMKRQSSASSHSSRQVVASPGSVGEHQPLRHAVKGRHTKIVLPRNHSSGRNLAKLARQTQNANTHALEDGRKHHRQRSHEGDTEIRLPGSLEETSKPQMRRNMTAYQLPRNTSHVKLKKNLSHGQLTRLGSGRNLAGLNVATHKAPPSPGLKGKSKRPKSVDLSGMERQLQESGQQSRKNSTKKVGFAVGSGDEGSDEDEVPGMEGHGAHEDEWTEESASASPYSTRQNTANNSRRPSVVVDKLNEKLPPLAGRPQDAKPASQRWQGESVQKESVEDQAEDSDSTEPPSPRSMARSRRNHDEQAQQAVQHAPVMRQDFSEATQAEPQESRVQEPAQPQREEAENDKHSATHPAPQRSVSSQQREHQNPSTRRLLDKGQQLPVPALVSNVSAMDDTHSNRGSPAPSLRSSKSNLADGAGDVQEDELVSRFVPSASHPSMGSGHNTAMNTPKQSGFHTPEDDSTLAAQRQEKHLSGFQLGPASPGSTVSGSSGATTPAIQRSRTELRMLQEKAMADLETVADQRPPLPAHVYDRRNESLKSYLNIAGLADGRGQLMGPDLFQGRFRALNTELRVVQKFRDPLGEAVARLKGCKGSKLNQHSAQQKARTGALTTSKSVVSLPAHRSEKTSDMSKSVSPPQSSHSLRKGVDGAQSTVQLQGAERQKGRREVSFARAAPADKRQLEAGREDVVPDHIARQFWDAI